MTVEAHAKINWSLFISGRRPDGYHLVDMILQRVSLCDLLDLTPSDSLVLRLDKSSAFSVPTDASNLILRAASALKARAPHSPGVCVTLTKKIPTGAGMGGGSADAAAVLLALNRLWGLGLSLRELEEIALPIGADIPFCLHTEPMRVTGIGERLFPLPPLPRRYLVILKGDESLNTGAVYKAYDSAPSPKGYDHAAALSALLSPSGHLKDCLVNVLEPPARALCPRVGEDIARLYAAGASFAMMTGSGSAVYGVFDSEKRAQDACARLRAESGDGVCAVACTL